jgi:tetratricopeptide (TPR) repeat protein
MPQPAADDYPTVFHTLIQRSVALAAAEAGRPDWRPQPEQQPQLLFALANALCLPAAWSTVLPLLTVLAPRFEQAGLRAEWLAYLERGIACCRISGDERTAADLALERGILLERLGRLPEAQASLTDALTGYAALGERGKLAKAHNRLAYVLCGRRAAAAAREHVEAARALLAPDDEETIYCHLVLGILAFDERAWAEAEAHSRRCVEGWRRSNDRRLYGMALINLSSIYSMTERNPQAIACLEEAVGILAAIGDVANEALVHLNLGAAYLFLEQPGAALRESQAAEAIYRRLDDQQRLALVYSNLALAHTGLGHWAEAEQHFTAALQRFSALEDYPNLVDTLLDLAQMHLQAGQPARAQARAEEAQGILPQLAAAGVRRYQAAKAAALLAAAGAPSSTP